MPIRLLLLSSFDSLETDVNLYYIQVIYKTYNLFIKRFIFEGENNSFLTMSRYESCIGFHDLLYIFTHYTWFIQRLDSYSITNFNFSYFILILLTIPTISCPGIIGSCDGKPYLFQSPSIRCKLERQRHMLLFLQVTHFLCL